MQTARESSPIREHEIVFQGGEAGFASGRDRGKVRAAIVLAILITGFLGLECFLPLGTAVKIGADEDFELSKATLCMKGYRLYTEIWNDQPPLVTFIITKVLEQVTPSILGPRLLTIGFTVALLVAFFLLVLRVNGLPAAGIATAMLIGSPGFIELSSSCMQEILALAPVVAALCVLVYRGQLLRTVIIAGAVFGFALQMKLIGVMYLPLAALILYLQRREDAEAIKKTLRAGTVFGAAVAATFVGLNYLTGSPLQVQLQQSWAAHFSSARSFEYGSPADRPFDWMVLMRNWDTTMPAILGMVLLGLFLRQWLRDGSAKPARNVLSRVKLGAPVPTQVLRLLPLCWVGLTFVVFPLHKPWWAYYYVHNAIGLCWCVGVAGAKAWEWLGLAAACVPSLLAAPTGRKNAKAATLGSRTAKTPIAWRVAVAASCLAVAGWVAARVYLEVNGIRGSQRVQSCMVLKEIQRFKPFTEFLFAHDPIYSFHSGIPMPPHLAMISLKRLWAGEMTNARLVEELESVKPGLVLLPNDAKEVPYQELLNREYKLVYFDRENRLFAHRSISKLGN